MTRSPVACVMLGAGRGGLEQALLDYVEALSGEDHPVTAVCHPRWLERPALERLPVTVAALRSFNEWDPLAARRLRRITEAAGAAGVITIGRRATTLARMAGVGPQIAVAQNYSLKPMVGVDHVFATTSDLERALVEAGQPAERITVIPNMVRLPRDTSPTDRHPRERAVIGALGRFVRKKGFVELIDALALLRERGLDFTLRLAGDGPDGETLRERIEAYGLAGRVEFPGWVTDKRAFFESLDVFCVPSLHEPFGIVVIEGLAHGCATVVTDAEGPSEIVTDGEHALMVPRGDPEALAGALARVIQEPALRARLASAGLAKARDHYALPVVAARLSTAVGHVVRVARP